MRISRERMYMDIAHALAKRSTCFRNNVGAVIVQPRGWVINGTGYNGPKSGLPHCKGNSCDLTSGGGCTRSIHAEDNALRRCYSYNSLLWLFVTRSPCEDCTKKILDNGQIVKVFYEEPYRDTEPLIILQRSGIEVYRVTPNGMVVDHKTNLIISDS